MGMIPGKFINGKFKPLCDMTTEELENIVYKSQLKKMLILLAVGILSGSILLLIFGV